MIGNVTDPSTSISKNGARLLEGAHAGAGTKPWLRAGAEVVIVEIVPVG
jgi:hypothetical protein